MSAVEGVELRWVEMPLRSPFQTSFGIETGQGGAAAADGHLGRRGLGRVRRDGRARSTPASSTPRSAAVIRHHLVPALVPGRRPDAGRRRRGTAARSRATGWPRARSRWPSSTPSCAARRRCRSRPTSARPADRVPLRGLGRHHGRHPDACSTAVGGYLDEGYVRIKLKIQPGWDLEPVRAVRAEFGDDLPLQVDANTAYTLRRRPAARPAGRVRPAADRAAPGRGGHDRPRAAGPADPYAGLPGRVDRQRQGRGRRDLARRLLGGEHQAGPGRGLSRGAAGARRLPGPRGAGLVRRDARDRPRPGGQHRARGPARLHADRRRLGLGPVLRRGHHRADHVAGRACRGADRARASVSRCSPTSWTGSPSARSGSPPPEPAR